MSIRAFLKRSLLLRNAYYYLLLWKRYVTTESEFERASCKFNIERGERKRYWYTLNKDALVFDVGGYKGDFSANIWKRFNCRCFCFEPVREFAEKIEERFRDNRDISVFSFGLSNKTENVPMMISADGSSSVIQRDNSIQNTAFMKDVSEFFKENNIEHVDLMKINIEGGEYALLERMAETDLLSKVDYFQIQFHELSEGDSLTRMKKIQAELDKTHVLEWAYRPYIWESWKRRS